MISMLALGGSFVQMAIAIIILIAVIAIVMVFIRHSGIGIPAWVWNIVWIVIGAAVAIIAIRFLLSL